MIMPNKYLSISNSLIGAGAVILEELSSACELSQLWNKVKHHRSIVANRKEFLAPEIKRLKGSIAKNRARLRELQHVD